MDEWTSTLAEVQQQLERLLRRARDAGALERGAFQWEAWKVYEAAALTLRLATTAAASTLGECRRAVQIGVHRSTTI